MYDAHVLGDLFGHEPTVIASVLQTFVSTTRSSLAELALAAQDLEVVAALAHKITGASRLSGILALGHAAHRVELAAKRGDMTAVQNGLTALDVQWRLAETAIATLSAPTSTPASLSK